MIKDIPDVFQSGYYVPEGGEFVQSDTLIAVKVVPDAFLNVLETGWSLFLSTTYMPTRNVWACIFPGVIDIQIVHGIKGYMI